MAELPGDRAALAADLERLQADYLATASGLSAGEFNRQAVPGKSWSVGQCVAHVAEINSLYLRPLQAASRRARGPYRPLVPNLLGRWFIREMEPPVRRRLPAPAPAVPASDLDLETTLKKFRSAQDAVLALVHDTAGLDLNRVRFGNPFLKSLRIFNVATGLLVIAAHERRHLEQARRVRATISA